MKRILLLTLFPALCCVCYGQGDQTIINVPIDQYGSTEQAILHLPDDYGQTTTKYPLLVFLHGIGEGGTNPATIYNSSGAGGPAYYIAHGQWPSSFVNPKDGKSYKYIVVSPQNNQGWSTSAVQLELILTYLFQHYRADPARLYLSGISAGGEGVVEYAGGATEGGTPVNGTHPVAAIVPMSAVINGQMEPQYASFLAQHNTHYWGFGSLSDIHGENTVDLGNDEDQDDANYALTTTYSGGHCCWMQFYTPSFQQNGLNIYQWALQFTQGTPAPPAPAPAPAPAPNPAPGPAPSPTGPMGAGFNIPGIIQAESWTTKTGGVGTQPTNDVGGGLNVGWIDRGDVMSYQVNVATAGQYTASFRVATTYSDASFQLQDGNGNVLCNVNPSNSGGFQNWETVNATVNLNAGSQMLRLVSTSWHIWNINWMEFSSSGAGPADGAQPIPGYVEADTYRDKTGNIATQTTTDAGGGLNVGWIDYGTYMDYYVNAASTGNYTVSFRVATALNNASLQLLDASGSVLCQVKVPNTGGFQTWQTVTTTAHFQSGAQTIRLQSTSWDIWNINWMNFAVNNQIGQSAAAAAISETPSTFEAMGTAGTTLWPNPVRDQLTIQLGDSLSGKTSIQLVDISGVVREVTNLEKTPGLTQVTVNAGGLPSGVYFVRILTRDRVEVKKVIKL